MVDGMAVASLQLALLSNRLLKVGMHHLNSTAFAFNTSGARIEQATEQHQLSALISHRLFPECCNVCKESSMPVFIADNAAFCVKPYCSAAAPVRYVLADMAVSCQAERLKLTPAMQTEGTANGTDSAAMELHPDAAASLDAAGGAAAVVVQGILQAMRNAPAAGLCPCSGCTGLSACLIGTVCTCIAETCWDSICNINAHHSLFPALTNDRDNKVCW